MTAIDLVDRAIGNAEPVFLSRVIACSSACRATASSAATAMGDGVKLRSKIPYRNIVVRMRRQAWFTWATDAEPSWIAASNAPS